MREGKIFLLAVAAFGVAAGPSVGQSLPSPVLPVPGAPPISVEGQFLYNSNVAASSAAIAAQRGLVRSDEIYTPSLDVNYIKELGAETFMVAGQAGYDFYQNNTILNRERLDGTAAVEGEVADCQVTLQGSYARFQSDLQDLSVVNVVQNTIGDISGGLDGTCNASGKLIPSLSVNPSWVNNSDLQLFSSDYRSIATQGSLLYKSTLLGEVSLLGQFTDTQFPHRLFLTANGIEEDGYKLYSGGLKLEHQFGSEIDVQGSVNEESLRSDSGIGPNFEGLTYDTSLAYSIGSRLVTKLSLSRKTNPSSVLNTSYMIAQDYRAEADYQFTTESHFNLGASDTKTDYEGAALIPGTDLTRESILSFFGTLGFDITPRLSLNLTATHDQRHADLLGYSYASARFGLSISQAF